MHLRKNVSKVNMSYNIAKFNFAPYLDITLSLFLRKWYLNAYIFFVLCGYALAAAVPVVMALLCPVRFSLRTRQIFQHKAAVKLPSDGPNGDSEQQAGQVK